ncbi:MAG: phosphate regulon transcriptional regulator PhoB [Methylococcaceae bacterium]
MPQFKILVVEDEEAIREMLVLVLQQVDFFVEAVADAHEADQYLEQTLPDLILLDWMLPAISGIEWARRIKKDEIYHEIPIILLTARGEEEDKVRGLEIGADDYVTKPFSPKELVARIRAVLRRAGKSPGSSTLTLDNLVLDSDLCSLMVEDKKVELSPTEFKLMHFFMQHPEKVYSRSQLLDRVWGHSVYIEERTVDVHILRLRKVLAEYGKEELIQTVRGFGYRFIFT